MQLNRLHFWILVFHCELKKLYLSDCFAFPGPFDQILTNKSRYQSGFADPNFRIKNPIDEIKHEGAGHSIG